MAWSNCFYDANECVISIVLAYEFVWCSVCICVWVCGSVYEFIEDQRMTRTDNQCIGRYIATVSSSSNYIGSLLHDNLVVLTRPIYSLYWGMGTCTLREKKITGKSIWRILFSENQFLRKKNSGFFSGKWLFRELDGQPFSFTKKSNHFIYLVSDYSFVFIGFQF